MVGKEDDGEIHTQKQMKASEYEQSREERIKENLERMRKLGIFDLSLEVKAIKPNKTRKTPQRLSVSPLPPSQPTRRSSRYTHSFLPFFLVFTFLLFFSIDCTIYFEIF